MEVLLMRYDKQSVTELHKLMKSVCHAENCNTPHTCPRQCKCERLFELNTNTAICWTFADLIAPLVYGSITDEHYVDTIMDQLDGLLRLCLFHDTEHSWMSFFRSGKSVLLVSMGGTHYDMTALDVMNLMRVVLPNLPRDPRIST